ncbi:MAG: universal stress protein [Deltaproteobacteria bacterium]|nr:universal stress protein [Deltaproteobacteria bacterium]
MSKNILFCLDNSDYSIAGVDLGLEIARAEGAEATGCHVYAARLHNERFRQMEGGLPEEYREEDALKNQREVHDTLITKGLRIISDSYTAVFLAKAKALGIESRGVSREGKNFEEIVKETGEGYDLVVMGAFGLGRTEPVRVGSVCERVVRKIKADLLAVKDSSFTAPKGGILVCVDGSPASFGGLERALRLSSVFGLPVEAVSVFDPCFHNVAFRSLAGVLSEEAGRLFKFREQEKLHEEIIDKGLARIYRGHLDTASSIARKGGVSIKTTLLSGKASAEIIRYAESIRPFLIVLGRTGAHATPSLDIGSTTENCLRECSANILVTSHELIPEANATRDEGPAWTEGASLILSSIPAFARALVKDMVEESARKEGLKEITPGYMRKVRKKMEG